MEDTLIVGAGLAGLACAIHARGRVRVLERNDRAGKKLLLSGTGQCNITHAGLPRSFLERYGEHGRFVKPVLLRTTNRDLVRFFEARGLAMREMQSDKPGGDGKVFPESRRAADVLAVLLHACRETSVEIDYGRHVAKIERLGNSGPGGPRFRVHTGKGGPYETRRLVLATGGCSFPATGSDGSGYEFAATLGHAIVPPRPALAPVFVRNHRFAACSGFSVAGTTTHLLRDGRKFRSEKPGDVLFTHKGLSGPAILDASRFILPGDVLRFSLLPAFRTVDECEKTLRAAFAEGGRRTLKTHLNRLGLPERLAAVVLETCGPEVANRTGAQVERETRLTLARSIVEAEFHVDGLGGWNEAMCTAGGVALEEVNPKTLESRRVPGLFFCGEILDVDGDCGGFNLQFAFSSGVLCANSNCEENKSRNGAAR